MGQHFSFRSLYRLNISGEIHALKHLIGQDNNMIHPVKSNCNA